MTLDSRVACQERHERFVRQVVASREVWGLRSDAGWCASSSQEEETLGAQVLPFWSHRAYAGPCAQGEWSVYAPAVIPLFEFVIAWLTGMHADGRLVGTNWSGHLIGLEVRPADLQRELVDAMPPDVRADFDAELARARQEVPGRFDVLPGPRGA